ncbi:hypothetical protein D9Q98_004966 [Chlorella vulgaris]|uniref:Uncharacterized protein n=1 Tax=Chlorella vulgaris TaxID=3077 RepID=A0A9D4TNK3_CHLVU|nr:hypothetical protein D9Q98_004966 [Chlorella vulgaris]
MELADVQQGAALATAAPPTVERQREQQRIQAPSYISPRDPGLRQLSSPADTQPHTSPAQPLLLARTAVLQRREKKRIAAPPSQRQCMQCGASTPGAGCHWRRHPATKEVWLCRLCYDRARRQLKRKRQHEAAATASDSDGGEESWEEDEEAQPLSTSSPATQQAAPVQPPLPGPPVQQHAPAAVFTEQFSEAREQQQQQQQQQQLALIPSATWETAPEQPALLPAHMPPAQASTALLVLEAAQQASAAAAGLTEGLAGTFAALLPMRAEQDECLRLMLQRRQYSGQQPERGLGCEGAAEAGFALLGAFEHRHTRSCHLLSPTIERLVRAGAGMELADVQQGAALATAAPPTVERQREQQQRIQAPSYISPWDPRLPQLSSPAETEPSPTPAQPLHPASTATASDNGSPVSAESEQGQLEGNNSQRRAQKRIAALPSQRQCLQCGASTPGVRRYWTRHPATKEGCLCHSCYYCAWKELKRKRQREAADGGCSSASGSDGGEESGQEDEQAQPPSQSPPVTRQAGPVQPPMPAPPVQQRVPAAMAADNFAEPGQQQQQALSLQQQGANPTATLETATEQPALLSAQPLQPKASTGILVLEAAQQASAAAAGLTEGLAGTFAALLPMPPEQDECLRLMLQRRQYSGAAGLMRAVLHLRGILPSGLPPACPE